MYKINDYLIYKQNTCLVSDILKDFYKGKDYYLLSPLSDLSLKIKIPTDNNDLKKIMSKKEALDLIDKMPLIKELDIDDKKLEQSYKELLRSGNKEDLVVIIKTTYLRNKKRKDNNKKLTDKDEKYFKEAEQTLYNEMGIALNKIFKETKEFIYDKLNILLDSKEN